MAAAKERAAAWGLSWFNFALSRDCVIQTSCDSNSKGGFQLKSMVEHGTLKFFACSDNYRRGVCVSPRRNALIKTIHFQHPGVLDVRGRRDFSRFDPR